MIFITHFFEPAQGETQVVFLQMDLKKTQREIQVVFPNGFGKSQREIQVVFFQMDLKKSGIREKTRESAKNIRPGKHYKTKGFALSEVAAPKSQNPPSETMQKALQNKGI